jgi:hypothetical protein
VRKAPGHRRPDGLAQTVDGQVRDPQLVGLESTALDVVRAIIDAEAPVTATEKPHARGRPCQALLAGHGSDHHMRRRVPRALG